MPTSSLNRRRLQCHQGLVIGALCWGSYLLLLLPTLGLVSAHIVWLVSVLARGNHVTLQFLTWPSVPLSCSNQPTQRLEPSYMPVRPFQAAERYSYLPMLLVGVPVLGGVTASLTSGPSNRRGGDSRTGSGKHSVRGGNRANRRPSNSTIAGSVVLMELSLGSLSIMLCMQV